MLIGTNRAFLQAVFKVLLLGLYLSIWLKMMAQLGLLVMRGLKFRGSISSLYNKLVLRLFSLFISMVMQVM